MMQAFYQGSCIMDQVFQYFLLTNSAFSDIIRLFAWKRGPVAQLVEHRPFKAGVLGSNPSRLTTPEINSNFEIVA